MEKAPVILLRRTLWASLCIALLLGLACGRDEEPLASRSVAQSAPEAGARPPSDGFGQRLGHDVTAQPGRGGDAPVTERPKIVALGNSLTAGLGVAAEEAYPAQLQRRLDEAGYRYRVVNAGVSGDTTAGGLRRVDWVLNSRPSIVILELGGNDGLRGLDPGQTKTNLEQIIKRLRSAGVTVVLAGIKLPPNYGADYTARFEAIYPELARTYRLTLIPFFLEGVATKTALNQADGIHPTGPGYRIIVDRMVPVLEPLLDKQGVRNPAEKGS